MLEQTDKKTSSDNFVKIYNIIKDSILERVHQVLGNMLRTMKIQKYDFDDMDYWSELLGLVVWAICSTHHTTL